MYIDVHKTCKGNTRDKVQNKVLNINTKQGKKKKNLSGLNYNEYNIGELAG